jgi:hypothetical protein
MFAKRSQQQRRDRKAASNFDDLLRGPSVTEANEAAS